MAKFKGILDNATRADSIVKEKYQNNREAMLLLEKPEAEIVAALPAAGVQSVTASASQVGQRQAAGWCRVTDQFLSRVLKSCGN